MRYALLMFLGFLVTNVHSQKLNIIDTTRIKCCYEFRGVGTRNDLVFLQIGSKCSKSYSFYTNRKDSILSTPNGRKKWGKMLNEAYDKMTDKMNFPSDFPEARSSEFVHKNYPTGKMTVTDKIVTDLYIYEDSLNLQDWEISKDSTKTIMGYECQQATCKFRGRVWTAWFALDLPISDGPWKLCGLPGLIMEAYDKGHLRHFLITGIQEQAEPIFLGKWGKGIKNFEKIEHDVFLKSQYEELRSGTRFNVAYQSLGIPTDNDSKTISYEYLEREDR